MIITINLSNELACVAKMCGGGDTVSKVDEEDLLSGIEISEGIQVALENFLTCYRAKLKYAEKEKE